MNKRKPRGPVPSLIGSTLGTPRRASVQRKSDCKRCGADILAGQSCVEIPSLGGSFANYKRYCEECFKAILEKTKTDLGELTAL